MRSYRRRYEEIVRQNLTGPPDAAIVTEADLTPLPPLIQTYLRNVGAVGRPHVHSFRAVFEGTFRNGLKGSKMPFRSEQVNTFDPPTRAFLMNGRAYGLPAEGLHLFQGGRATMQIRMARLFQVVDAHGPRMDQSETVTLFNDLCLFAPAALIRMRQVRWEEDGAQSVKAAFPLVDHTIQARLVFLPDGDLADFVSPDRFLSQDGKTYESYPWSTPVHAYAEHDGRRIPSLAEAVWHTPEGAFPYGRFQLVEIQYNPKVT